MAALLGRGVHTMNVIDATILPKVGFYGSTHRARKVTTAVCESEVAINQALHIGNGTNVKIQSVDYIYPTFD
ncbi:unnamed protein product [Brassica oleracea var. botrytis]